MTEQKLPIKFEFDSNKKETFLKFWEVKDYQEFLKKIKNKMLLFHYYTRLSNSQHSVLNEIVNNKKGYKDLEFQKDDIEFLDSINFINVQKDRSNLKNGQNSITFNDPLQLLLEIGRINSIDDLPDSSSSVQKKMEDDERKALYAMYIHFLYHKKLDYHLYEKLYNNKYISLSVLPDLTPVVFALSNGGFEFTLESEDKESGKSEIYSRTAFFIHTAEEILFQIALHQNSKASLRNNLKNIRKECHFSVEVIEKLSEFFSQRNMAAFLGFGFYQKLRYIMFKVFPREYNILKIIFKHLKKTNYIAIHDLLNQLNRIKYRQKIKMILSGEKETDEYLFLANLSIDDLQDSLSVLKDTGLIHMKDNNVFIDRALLHKIFLKKNKKKKNVDNNNSDRIIINSDLSVNIYREHATPYIMYILYSFMQAEFSEYIYTFTFNKVKSSFLFFSGKNVSEVKCFFKKHASETWSDNMDHQIDFIFNNSNILLGGHHYVLRARTEKSYFTLEHILAGQNIDHNPVKEIFTVFFENKKDFILACEKLKKEGVEIAQYINI